MRKFNLYLLLFAVLGTAMTSCQDENLEAFDGDSSQGGNFETVNVEISAEKGRTLTKSSIDGLEFSWAEGDNLSIYNGKSLNSEFKLTGAASATSSFAGSLGVANSVIYAVYPYATSTTFTPGETVTCDLKFPVTQLQDHNDDKTIVPTSIGKYAYMTGCTAAAVNVVDDATSFNMTLSQVSTIYDFVISNINVANTKVHSLVLKSNDNVFGTSATVGFNSDGSAPTIVPSGTKVNQIEVKLNDGAGVEVVNNTITVRLAMLPQTFAAQKWTVELNTSVGEAEATTKSSFTIDLEEELVSLPGSRDQFALDYSSLVAPTTMTEDIRRVLNPGVGFYVAHTIRIPDDNSTGSYIDQAALEAEKHTIAQLRFGLEEFSLNATNPLTTGANGAWNVVTGEDKELPDAVMARLRATFDALRVANKTAILRFSYNLDGMHNGSWAPTRREPPIDLLKKHIQQIGEIVNENKDIVNGIESAMFGSYGEQHLTAQIVIDIPTICYDITEAWLDATTDVAVTLRSPSHYLRWLNQAKGESFTTDNIGSFDLDGSDSKTKRVGCYAGGSYLASESDDGTYVNRVEEIKFLTKAARYTPFGGEVTHHHSLAGINDYNNVEHLEVEGFKTHTSYINSGHNLTILNIWKAETYDGVDALYNGSGLTDYQFVENRLGYRIFVSAKSLSVTADKINVAVTLNNVGFANVITNKKVQIVLKNETTEQVIDTDFDIKSVQSQGKANFEVSIDKSLVTAGTYEVYMKVSSSYAPNDSNLRTIQFANAVELWNADMGANLLDEVIIN